MQKRPESGSAARPERKNPEIQLLRLIMAFEIALFHGRGGGGYLAVDFFFVLTGYFSVRRALSHPDASCRDAALWTVRKFAPIYAYAIPICAVHLLARGLLLGTGLRQALRSLAYGSYQIALLSASGLFDGSHNFVSHLWYLSCLLMLLPLFYSLLIKKKDFFLYVLAPLSALFLYGYCAQAFGGLLISHEWSGLFLTGLIRAWAGLCAGAAAYLLARKLRALPPMTKLALRLLSAAQLLCLFGGLLYMHAQEGGMLDFLCVFLWIALVGVVLSERASIHPLFAPLGECAPLSELSLSLYLTHWTIPLLLRACTPDASVPMLPYLILSLLYAALWVFIVSLARKLLSRLRLKELLFS